MNAEMIYISVKLKYETNNICQFNGKNKKIQVFLSLQNM